jgi:hypothetical protein
VSSKYQCQRSSCVGNQEGRSLEAVWKKKEISKELERRCLIRGLKKDWKKKKKKEEEEEEEEGGALEW